MGNARQMVDRNFQWDSKPTHSMDIEGISQIHRQYLGPWGWSIWEKKFRVGGQGQSQIHWKVRFRGRAEDGNPRFSHEEENPNLKSNFLVPIVLILEKKSPRFRRHQDPRKDSKFAGWKIFNPRSGNRIPKGRFHQRKILKIKRIPMNLGHESLEQKQCCTLFFVGAEFISFPLIYIRIHRTNLRAPTEDPGPQKPGSWIYGGAQIPSAAICVPYSIGGSNIVWKSEYMDFSRCMEKSIYSGRETSRSQKTHAILWGRICKIRIQAPEKTTDSIGKKRNLNSRGESDSQHNSNPYENLLVNPSSFMKDPNSSPRGTPCGRKKIVSGPASKFWASRRRVLCSVSFPFRIEKNVARIGDPKIRIMSQVSNYNANFQEKPGSGSQFWKAHRIRFWNLI